MKQKSVSIKFLTSLYLIVPLCLLFIAVDQYFFVGIIKSELPRTPNELFFFNIFFVLPHIVASSTTLLDKDYLSFYKQKLIIALLLTAFIAFICPSIFSKNFVLIINGVLTVYHVLAQQLGVTATIAKVRSKLYQAWKIIGLLLGALIYYLFYFYSTIGIDKIFYLDRAVISLGIIFAIMSCLLAKETNEKMGKTYIFANFFLILSAYYFIINGYPFLAMLAPRVVHDLTAFSFYTVHDNNRNLDQPKNFVFKFLHKFKAGSKLRYFFITPMTGITIAFFAKAFLIFPVINFLTLFHYATESFVWKSEGIHRKFINFS